MLKPVICSLSLVVGLTVFANPKKSVLETVEVFFTGDGFVCPTSMNPLEFVGISECFFGILTTPRLWSSLTSTMSGVFFFFPNIILLLGRGGIKRFWS